MQKFWDGARFIVSSKKCSTDTFWKAVTKDFEINSEANLKFLRKFNHKMFLLHEISKILIVRLDQINTKENSKLIPTFNFSTLYNKLQHKVLLKVLFDLIDFSYNGGSEKNILSGFAERFL